MKVVVASRMAAVDAAGNGGSGTMVRVTTKSKNREVAVVVAGRGGRRGVAGGDGGGRPRWSRDKKLANRPHTGILFSRESKPCPHMLLDSSAT